MSSDDLCTLQEEDDDMISIDEIIEIPDLEEEKEKIDEKDEAFEKTLESLSKTAELALGLMGVNDTKIRPPKLGIMRRVGLKKIASVNNISGKNALILISPNPITTLSSVNIGFSGFNFGFTLKQNGDYLTQEIPIMSGTRTEIELDNTQYRCTLYIDIDGKLVRTWENRSFNTMCYDINILRRHVVLAQTISQKM